MSTTRKAIIKKVKRIDPNFKEAPSIFTGWECSMEDFVEICAKFAEIDKVFEVKNIDIRSEDNLSLLHSSEGPFKASSYGYSKDEELIKLVDQIAALMRNPFALAGQLKDLDNALGIVMQNENLHFNDGDLPEFLIAGNGHFIPGPPPEDYKPKKKARILETLLLNREKEHGINVEGITPKFSGFVNGGSANRLVSSGYLFSEDKQVSRQLLHGSYTHRLAFEAIRGAARTGELNLKYDGGKEELSMKNLLDLLVYGNYWSEKDDDKEKLWSLLLDTTRDSKKLAEFEEAQLNKGYLNSNKYSFSSCSPFVFNSLLLCFGKELGLPNLQYYLLDSHYKASFEMVDRVRKAMPPSTMISNNDLYIFCLEAMSLSVGVLLGSADKELPFALLGFQEKDQNDYRNYTAFPCSLGGLSREGIVKKVEKTLSVGKYDSWEDFFRSKQSFFSKPEETTANASFFSEKNNTSSEQSPLPRPHQ